MSYQELKDRIRDFKINYSKKIDSRISKSGLDITAYILGSILDAYEEIQEEFDKDVLLQESARDVLSQDLLCYIDPKMKLGGLLAMNVGKGYVKSFDSERKKQKQKQLELKQKQIQQQKQILQQKQEQLNQEEKKDN